jgi:hypothetical protein
MNEKRLPCGRKEISGKWKWERKGFEGVKKMKVYIFIYIYMYMRA